MKTIFLPTLLRNIESVLRITLREPALETHAQIERLGSKRNQYGDEVLTRQNACVVNEIKSNIIRLLELGFELQQFFYLLVNT